MNRLLGLAFLLISLWACADSQQDENAGVTSTGNAGEVAGIVVVQGSAALTKSVAAQTNLVLDSALVLLLDENLVLVDSMRTNREGNFWFRDVNPGSYIVRVEFADKESQVQLSVKESKQALVNLRLGGSSAVALSMDSAIGLYTAERGRVWQRAHLKYEYNASAKEVHVTRTNGGSDSLQGIWLVQYMGLEMNLRNPQQASCETTRRFFSTYPEEIVDNNWYYNGNLAADYSGDSDCSLALAGMQEMSTMGMGGLEMQFGLKDDLKVAFYDGDWCLSEVVDLKKLYGPMLPEGSTATVRNCNSFRVNFAEGDSAVVRVLWYDPTFEDGIEEIRNGTNTCVRRGPLRAFGQNWCK